MPSRRVLGALVAAVFAIGLLAGAALGPAPEGSPADSSTIVQRVIALLATRGDGRSPASAPVTPAPSDVSSASATTAGAAHASKSRGSQPPVKGATAPSSPESSSTGESATGSEHRSSSGPGTGEDRASHKPARLPPIQHVWLIVLSGSTIPEAETAPTGYPYLVGRLVRQGVLLKTYSALDAYELAGDATLLPGGVGASLSVIQEPGCVGTAGTSAAEATATAPATAPGTGPCTPGAQTGLSEADKFLQGTVGPILAGATYRENGLVVVTFASAQAGAGASTSTLALQPVAGALLLSPLLRGGATSTGPFDSLSPRTSLASIFRP